MKLCKFAFYIDINIQHFPEMCEVSENLRRFLKFLSIIFGWLNNDSYGMYLDEFMCRNYKEFCKTQEFKVFHEQLCVSIGNLDGSLIRRCQVLRIKLIQLLDIIRCIIIRDF